MSVSRQDTENKQLNFLPATGKAGNAYAKLPQSLLFKPIQLNQEIEKRMQENTLFMKLEMNAKKNFRAAINLKNQNKLPEAIDICVLNLTKLFSLLKVYTDFSSKRVDVYKWLVKYEYFLAKLQEASNNPKAKLDSFNNARSFINDLPPELYEKHKDFFSAYKIDLHLFYADNFKDNNDMDSAVAEWEAALKILNAKPSRNEFEQSEIDRIKVLIGNSLQSKEDKLLELFEENLSLANTLASQGDLVGACKKINNQINIINIVLKDTKSLAVKNKAYRLLTGNYSQLYTLHHSVGNKNKLEKYFNLMRSTFCNWELHHEKSDQEDIKKWEIYFHEVDGDFFNNMREWKKAIVHWKAGVNLLSSISLFTNDDVVKMNNLNSKIKKATEEKLQSSKMQRSTAHKL